VAMVLGRDQGGEVRAFGCLDQRAGAARAEVASMP